MLRYFIILAPAFFCMHFPFAARQDKINMEDRCQQKIDTLTKLLIYTAADEPPAPVGGEGALRSKMERMLDPNLQLDSGKVASKVIVAVIVDKDGSIKGERIITPTNKNWGEQMLNAARSIKWIPAKCNGKNVAMLYQLPVLTICFSEE